MFLVVRVHQYFLQQVFFFYLCLLIFLTANFFFLLVFIDISYGKFGSTDGYVMDVHLIEMAERTDT